MINLRKFHTRPGVGKTNLSAGVPMQLKWNFETGLVTEEDPNDEPTETDDTSTDKETA
tara:strand:+ start:710 stop:883 length:174 start_codon:yes stop_codon:yes gene_type:complete